MAEKKYTHEEKLNKMHDLIAEITGMNRGDVVELHRTQQNKYRSLVRTHFAEIHKRRTEEGWF